MNTHIATIVKKIQSVSNRFFWNRRKTIHSLNEIIPIRSELFSAVQMQQHGAVLAQTHLLCTGHKSDQLLARLADNEHVITDACNQLTASIKAGQQITPAAIWLLDNFYLIDEQIRTAKHHLPKNYSRELPRLMQGQTAGRPRVYDIALEAIAHGDGRVDPENLSHFVEAYQRVTTLKLGELWAIPIMLRLALIENLRRVSERLNRDRYNRQLADSWAQQMIETALTNPNQLILLVADMARSNPPMESSFVAELVRRLQGESPTLSLPLTWLAQRLNESGEHIDNIIQLETQKQAADQVSISNSISSLRFLSKMDWQDFVEKMSVVNQILIKDPAMIYEKMDFATRDQYRHSVEKIARDNNQSEVNVALFSVELANDKVETKGNADRSAHVGFYLIDQGLPQLEQKIGVKRNWCLAHLHRIHLAIKANPLSLYLGTIFCITGLVTAKVMIRSQSLNLELLLISALLCFLATSQFSVTIVNWLSTFFTHPKLLPRMDFSEQIPDAFRTLVAVPSMLTSRENTDHLIESLEVRFLANHDNNLRFCLLTDYGDAQTEHLPTDNELLDYIKNAINNLNLRYRHFGVDYFMLFHRPRSWNSHDNIWMGHERKRGKLTELNALLCHGITAAFSLIIGNLTEFKVKYVITLDTDTDLPRDAAKKFVATMAHPLNQAQYSPDRKSICAGYGILQPRVVVCLPGTDASLYELLCGGQAGIDPYTRTVSDVYQDLFREGSYIGKGIYDVDVFDQLLYNRMPDNRILSHDLLEGCYIRAGLLSDIHLYEQYPSNYSADTSRRYRWIRGDWQIASWISRTVPDYDGTRSKNPLSMLSRWKIADNLRRSLVSFSLAGLLIISWATSGNAGLWTCLAFGIYFVPILCVLIFKLIHQPDNVFFRQHLMSVLKSAATHLAHVALTLSFLPFEAWVNMDAIIRTHWRLLVSHKHLLQWSPSDSRYPSHQQSCFYYYQLMFSAPLIALLTASYLVVYRIQVLIIASPLLILWWASPLIAYLVSKPVLHHVAHLSEIQVTYLKKIARKIWLFFETYVGPEDHWLPPDNMQEKPIGATAHRTSPTNIGLLLTANFAAWDFGYLSMGKMLERTESTLTTLSLLERYEGHFFNWYNTLDLIPLEPRYVSAVDSGNLAAHLLTVRSGLHDLARNSICSDQLFAGIKDTYAIFISLPEARLLLCLQQFEDALHAACQLPALNINSSYGYIEQLARCSHYFLDQTTATSTEATQLRIWATSLAKQCQDVLNELNFIFPWLELLKNNEWKAEFVRHIDTSSLQKLSETSLDSDHFLSFKNQHPQDEYDALLNAVSLGIDHVKARLSQIGKLISMTTDFSQMDYGFLYNPITHLLSIGYNVTDRRRDSGCYDLLASEARLTTFVAIAQGQLPQESWFALGRQLTIASGNPILLSWSGSMFEYLMPLLIMPTFNNTLLDQTYHSAVERQMEYGLQRGKVWGISESGYQNFDGHLNYQYRAFGVPGLGFKRGLGDDLVIAPYASVMALMVMPDFACQNLMVLSAQGYEGQYGLYEAIDFTSARLSRGQDHTVIYSFMAHHQAMSFLAIAYILLDRPMQKRFESDSHFQATLPLLLERVPKATSTYSNTTELADIRTLSSTENLHTRILTTPDSAVPDVQLLSNGRYHVMVTNGGGSYSQWNNLAITRWREDTTRDNWGTFGFIRNLDDGHFFSTAFQPALVPSKTYEVIFSEGRVEFRRTDYNFDVHTEIVVSPEDDVELRRTTITNRGRNVKIIDFTSYAEVVLAPANADALHPAFSNLFIQTEIISDSNAILCTRRPSASDQKNPWLFHLVSTHGAKVNEVSYETDRNQFIGRGNTIAMPDAMLHSGPLSGNHGSVLDPIVAIRYQITLEAEQIVTVDMITGIAESRATCLELVNKFQDIHTAYRVIELAWTHSQVVLRQLNATEADAQLYNRLASSIIFVNPALRADAHILKRNLRGQSGLWSYTISGDLPIILVQIKNIENMVLIQQLVQAHSYWSSRGLAVDLVIWNEDHAIYRQVMQDQILGLVSSTINRQPSERRGSIFVRIADQITHEDRVLFQSVARIILDDGAGTLAEQINRREGAKNIPPRLITSTHPAKSAGRPFPSAKSEAGFANHFGGFSADGREYVINLDANQTTPAPWSNVIANAQFGTVISESGQAYTWGENAHEYRLTPWANDPVSDLSGEAFYVRDEESGKYWSPTPLPCRGTGPYTTRHGFGYSIFEHDEDGITSTLTIFVALNTSVKYAILKIQNNTEQVRKLSVTGYTEWVLGDLRSKSAMHIVTECESMSGTIFARNAFNTDFADRVAFFQVNATSPSFTCDRGEFIGRNRSLQHPAALERVRLSGKVGAGLDPCAALLVPFDLPPGDQRQLTFTLGMANTRQTNLTELIQQNYGTLHADIALAKVKDYWESTLGAVQVKTPDIGLNLLANGWLMYQTIACRLWARSGYYQSGGAFGFRDQLQDGMAMVHTEPQLLRGHLLRCASHQFVEGDVQHWWHPPGNRGVRTKCSDDFLWLPMATLRYVTCTDDQTVLDEIVPFLEGRMLSEQESSYYDTPTVSTRTASLYDHCKLAIERGLRFGSHGLSLIGSCDWNDGMDKVGDQGKGESVWLSFFLVDILTRFSLTASQRNDNTFAEHCKTEAAKLTVNINTNGWDGAWYRRAYFDDGTLLGSISNLECQIDSLPQSWSVLSGAGELKKSESAMQSVKQRLVSQKDQVVKLLDPPFDISTQNPGYIRGYVPGVRENGGQYNHAAIWVAMAFAKLGDRDNAWALMNIINPINHTVTQSDCEIYKVEPYVVAADVYAMAPHIGRGGWTWYTGSAGWMFRFILESLLGLTRTGNQLTLKPCIPLIWDKYELRYRYFSTVYTITVLQQDKNDNAPSANTLVLVDDKVEHHVEMIVYR